MVVAELTRRSRLRVLAALFMAAGYVLTATASTAADEQGSELYFSANALYNRKLYDLAIKEYTRFLADHPNHSKKAQAGLGLGLSYYALEKYKEAAPLLEKAGADEQLPNQAHIRLLYGQCMLALSRVADAETAFASVAASDAPENIKRDAAIGLVDALYQQEKWQSVVTAGSALSSSTDAGARTVRAKFKGAAARYHLNDYAGASKILSGLDELGDDPALAHQGAFLLGECRRQTGDLAGAARHFSVAAEKHQGPLSGDARFRLGYVLFSQDKYAEAAASLSAFLADFPDHGSADQAKLFLGQAHLELKQYDEAVATLAPLVKRQPPNPDAVLWLARAYSRREKFADACATIQGAVSRMPTNAPPSRELVFDLGNNLMSDQKYAQAVQAFSTIVSGHPDWDQAPDVLRLRAVCLHRAEKLAKSLADCDAFLAKYAGHASIDELAFLKAENQFFLDMHDAALASYTQFIGAYPKSESGCHTTSYRPASVSKKSLAGSP